MAIRHGDVLLNSDNTIFGRNGDLAHGDAIEQHTGAIINASNGNFRKWPTLAANLVLTLDAPLDSRDIASRVQNSLFLDGWRPNSLNINTDLANEKIEVTLGNVVKVTDLTSSLL